MLGAVNKLTKIQLAPLIMTAFGLLLVRVHVRILSITRMDGHTRSWCVGCGAVPA